MRGLRRRQAPIATVSHDFDASPAANLRLPARRPRPRASAAFWQPPPQVADRSAPTACGRNCRRDCQRTLDGFLAAGRPGRQLAKLAMVGMMYTVPGRSGSWRPTISWGSPAGELAKTQSQQVRQRRTGKKDQHAQWKRLFEDLDHIVSVKRGPEFSVIKSPIQLTYCCQSGRLSPNSSRRASR